MNPFARALAEWVVALTSGAIGLDPIARARLARLSGRTIVLEPDDPAETVVLKLDHAGIRVVDRDGTRPTVVVRGSAAALLGAFARGAFAEAARDPTGRDAIDIEGDEVTLAEFADIVRTTRPDVEAPLARLIGAAPAQNLVGFLELSLTTLGRVVRDLGAEGARVVRTGAAQRYLARAEFEAFVARRRAAALSLDRLSARLDRFDRPAEEPS